MTQSPRIALDAYPDFPGRRGARPLLDHLSVLRHPEAQAVEENRRARHGGSEASRLSRRSASLAIQRQLTDR